MTDLSHGIWIWLAKGSGAVAGSAISIAYFLPKSRREAAIRFTVGLVSGLVFGGTVGVKIASEFGIAAVLGKFETLLMGSALASLSAWWAIGALIRFLQKTGVATDANDTRSNTNQRNGS